MTTVVALGHNKVAWDTHDFLTSVQLRPREATGFWDTEQDEQKFYPISIMHPSFLADINTSPYVSAVE